MAKAKILTSNIYENMQLDEMTIQAASRPESSAMVLTYVVSFPRPWKSFSHDAVMDVPIGSLPFFVRAQAERPGIAADPHPPCPARRMTRPRPSLMPCLLRAIPRPAPRGGRRLVGLSLVNPVQVRTEIDHIASWQFESRSGE